MDQSREDADAHSSAISSGGGGGSSRTPGRVERNESASEKDLEVHQLLNEVARLTGLSWSLAKAAGRPLSSLQSGLIKPPPDLFDLPPRVTSPPMAGSNNNAFPPLDTSFNRSPSPSPGSQINGAAMSNNANYMAPLPLGHQQDLNYLYAQIQELSGILQSNRDKVNEITRSAEEVARRANTTSQSTTDDTNESNEDRETDKSRIRQLEHQLAKSNKLIALYKHEQTENTRLLASYEEAMGTATEQVRNYCNDIDSRFLAQRRHYNGLLQAEKDEHLQSRLDRDHWQAQTVKVCEMIRTAYKLRSEEWCDEYKVIRGLQEEVRCLRRCLGMEAEKVDEETGWPYLKEDVLLGEAVGGGQIYAVQQ